MHRLQHDHKMLVGLKSSLRALKNHSAKTLYIADDAEQHILRKLLIEAEGTSVDIVHVDSMKTLGRWCNIDVGAAVAVIIE